MDAKRVNPLNTCAHLHNSSLTKSLEGPTPTHGEAPNKWSPLLELKRALLPSLKYEWLGSGEGQRFTKSSDKQALNAQGSLNSDKLEAIYLEVKKL